MDGKTLQSVRRAANRLEPRERTAAVAVAVYAAGAFVVIRAIGDITNLQLAVGIALSALTVVALRFDHRLLVGIASAAIGGFGPWKMWGLFALPLLVFTTYLLVKARNAQERGLRTARAGMASDVEATGMGDTDDTGDTADADSGEDAEPPKLSRRAQKPHPRSKKKQKRRR